MASNKTKTRLFPVDMWRTNLMQVKMSPEDRFFWVYINTNPQTTVELKILPDDSLKYVRRANDEVKIDKENPRIEVVIKEINDYGEQQNEN